MKAVTLYNWVTHPRSRPTAPAIGGAVGTLVSSYSGAAATSYGLALLGGGSLAAGGLGMAGGALVVAALGGALGGALGASVANAYLREDKSFHIDLLQEGQGVPVVVCDGFLSEGGTGWGEWPTIVARRFPDPPVYRVHWGAKELRDLGILAGFGAVKVAGPAALKQAALAATTTRPTTMSSSTCTPSPRQVRQRPASKALCRVLPN